MLETALLLSLVAIVSLAGLQSLGTEIFDQLDLAANAFNGGTLQLKLGGGKGL